MSESKLGILLNELHRVREQHAGIPTDEVEQLLDDLDDVIGEIRELSRDQEIADAARAILNGGMMIDPDVKLSIRSVEDLIEWYKKSGQEELR